MVSITQFWPKHNFDQTEVGQTKFIHISLANPKRFQEPNHSFPTTLLPWHILPGGATWVDWVATLAGVLGEREGFTKSAQQDHPNMLGLIVRQHVGLGDWKESRAHLGRRGEGGAGPR